MRCVSVQVKKDVTRSKRPVGHRFLHLLSGDHEAVVQQAQQLLSCQPRVLWVTSVTDIVLTPESLALPAKKTRAVLGQEFFFIVFDAFSGFDTNAFAAVSGTLRGGGVLLLLAPPPAQWVNYPDPDYARFLPHPYQPADVKGRFLQRFVRLLHAGDVSLAVSAFDKQVAILPLDGVENAAASDQQHALDVILRVTLPVVLTADRGRGKSAVLGMAADRLLGEGKRVLLTAPSKATVATVYKHAGSAADRLVFIAPDDLLQTLPDADVVLVDEAAAISVPMLVQILNAYPRCVFSTTLHGYEGSGRGFILRFQKHLDAVVSEWQQITLRQPVRWAENDPLEAFINQVCLLSVDTYRTMSAKLRQAAAAVRYQRIERDDLVVNEALLQQVFGLLVTAHYQTRPSDLRQMLDAPQLSVHVLQIGGQVVAVALLSREGGLDKALTAAIHAGKRRPHGHLLPQSLTFHAGIEGGAGLLCERVMRIAVHPDVQGQGLGSTLLHHVKRYAQQQGADYVGVSYAATPVLPVFWERAGFRSVRLGYRKDTASGARSLMQVYPLTLAGETLAAQAHQQFLENR